MSGHVHRRCQVGRSLPTSRSLVTYLECDMEFVWPLKYLESSPHNHKILSLQLVPQNPQPSELIKTRRMPVVQEAAPVCPIAHSVFSEWIVRSRHALRSPLRRSQSSHAPSGRETSVADSSLTSRSTSGSS